MQKNNKSKQQQQEKWESKYYQWQSRWMGVSRCQDSGENWGCALTVCVLCAQLCLTLYDPMDGSLRGFCPWDFPGKNTGVGCHALLQGPSQPRDWTCIFCTGKWILYHWAAWEAFRRQGFTILRYTSSAISGWVLLSRPVATSSVALHI